MSKVLINQYYQNLDRTLQFGKSGNEQSIRNHFWALLNSYARNYNYEVVPEISVMGTSGRKVKPDGVVKNLWGLDIGLWESKDEKDVIEAEIDSKVKKGYPLTNILFEDSNIAVLIQRGQEVQRVEVRDADKLNSIITQFFSFKSETVYKFEDAIDKFKADIPKIVETLRNRIVASRESNPGFIAAQKTFLELCKVEINPSITLEDIREMMIQHILTSDIFNKIFDDPDFHRHNTIAAELENLIAKLFTYEERRNLLGSIEHYYEAINATAAGITDHHEKQKFLKVLYENFYKVYNPKAADRLGVVYTPNEIVRFMVKSADHLLHKHFGKTLADRNVDILDPATGTGTFICEVIEHAIPKGQLEYKYKNEIHANEVAILPYYIANLNVEFTYKQKMGQYSEFPNLCFVDTLDNVSGLEAGIGADMLRYKRQDSLFAITSENSERIKRQNARKISVIIGNPPYNANQLNENENNKNREYPFIDKRIKETYIKHSTAQKTKVYDMYARFLRWASDRIDKNGIIAFVSNSSFVDSRTYDGFRKCVSAEFNEVHIIDLKGNARTSGERRRREGGNVFSDQIRVGVAVYFLVKNQKEKGCKIYYNSIKDYAKAEEKKDYLKVSDLSELQFNPIHPDKTNNWINLAEDSDWEELVPLASKEVKSGKSKEAVFELFSLGVVTARDEWVYDDDPQLLEKKVQHLIDVYDSDLKNLKGKNKEEIADGVDYSIKWTRAVKKDLLKGKKYAFNENLIIESLYRPFVKRKLYFSKELNEMQYQMSQVFSSEKKSNLIGFLQGKRQPFSIFSADVIPNYAMFSLDYAQCLPLYRYSSSGERTDNITDWGLEQFQNHYGDKKITKEDIFHYTYAVLHNPAYRKKYELNLKREFPRLPFYSDFKKWATWGKKLMDLHINYETVEPFGLELIETETKAAAKRERELISEVSEPQALYKREVRIKAKLKADKEKGIIELDELSFLKGVPKEAWEYKLGNRSALEWILDQYKEKKPKDPTIAEKFNTYRFPDYKDKVIDLLRRVTTVSVETMKIVREMGGE
ncbi:MAG TPA: N-6 DNA methylase [Acidobacteriota bacterium]|nr:N-6 DNA methylase [Acidobacteriota bacterium]HNT18368.1 N-6 DNA methylase [Acidobacteriota bacterium]